MAGKDVPPPKIEGLVIEEKIGGGGFSTVYSARQKRHDRSVAVKVLRGEQFDAVRLEQFESETRTMGRVSNHPYIVTVFDADVSADGRPYIVMALYDRGHYGQRARHSTLQQAEVLRVGIQVAAAVETAHRAGIIHRDIKPENVLIDEYGHSGLTDFGIASVHAAAAHADDAMTVAYAAPELLTGAGRPSAASDIWALGATLWALLTGTPPFGTGSGSSEVEVMHRITTASLPEFPRADVHSRLVQVLRHSLEKEPDARPASAADFARALQRVEIEIGMLPTPIELPEEATQESVLTGALPDAFPTAASRPDMPSAREQGNDDAMTTDGPGAILIPEIRGPRQRKDPVRPQPAALTGSPPTVIRQRDGVEVAAEPPATRSDRNPRRLLMIGAAVLLVVVAGLALLAVVGGNDPAEGGGGRATLTLPPETLPPNPLPPVVAMKAVAGRPNLARVTWHVDNQRAGDALGYGTTRDAAVAPVERRPAFELTLPPDARGCLYFWTVRAGRRGEEMRKCTDS